MYRNSYEYESLVGIIPVRHFCSTGNAENEPATLNKAYEACAASTLGAMRLVNVQLALGNFRVMKYFIPGTISYINISYISITVYEALRAKISIISYPTHQ